MLNAQTDNVLTYCEQSMVLEDNSFSISKVSCDSLAFFPIENDASELWIHSVILVESQAVLGDHIELSTEHRECLAILSWRLASGKPTILTLLTTE